MKGVKEEKKTLWDRVKSWFVNIWNRFTSLFSSNKSKVTVADQSKGETPTEGEGMEAVPKVTTEPAVEMLPLEALGYIVIPDCNTYLRLVVREDYISRVKNTVGEEKVCLIYAMIGEKAYRITCGNCSMGGEGFSIKSIANQNGTDVLDDLTKMIGKLGLNGTTTYVVITRISENPIEPKVKSPDQANTVKSNSEAPRQLQGDGPAIPATETPPQQPEGATPEMAAEAKKGESEKVGKNGNPELTTGDQQETPPAVEKPAVTKEKPLLPKKPVPADGMKNPTSTKGGQQEKTPPVVPKKTGDCGAYKS